jgi:hypothetical protein
MYNCPTILTKALSERAPELKNVEICHLHTEGDALCESRVSGKFSCKFVFIGKNVRHTLKAGNGSYTPVF